MIKMSLLINKTRMRKKIMMRNMINLIILVEEHQEKASFMKVERKIIIKILRNKQQDLKLI